MIIGRGVVAELLDRDPSSPYGEVILYVQRKNQRDMRISTELQLYENRLVFWGSHTNRFVLATSDRPGQQANLFVFDLQEGTCKLLWTAPSRSLDTCRNLDMVMLAVKTSGSGCTIAALVVEADYSVQNREELLGSVFVASVDVKSQFVHTVRTIACEHVRPGVSRIIPCFIGAAAAHLIAIEDGSGATYSLGHEDGGGLMHFAGETWLATDLPVCGHVLPTAERHHEIMAVTHVTGTNIVLLVAFGPCQASKDHKWQVVETLCNFRPSSASSPPPWVSTVRVSGVWYDKYDISQEVGVGVTLHSTDPGDSVTFPDLYSMDFGELRKTWMQTCVSVALSRLAAGTLTQY